MKSIITLILVLISLGGLSQENEAAKKHQYLKEINALSDRAYKALKPYADKEVKGSLPGRCVVTDFVMKEYQGFTEVMPVGRMVSKCRLYVNALFIRDTLLYTNTNIYIRHKGKKYKSDRFHEWTVIELKPKSKRQKRLLRYASEVGDREFLMNQVPVEVIEEVVKPFKDK